MLHSAKIIKTFVVCLALFFLAIALYPAFMPLKAVKQTPLQQGINVTDFTGHEIVLQRPAQRIVCLLESSLAALYMLEAQEQVVGVNNYPYQPHIYPYYSAIDKRFLENTLPMVGEGELVNIEKIAALKPDLVIIWSGYPTIIKGLRERGFTVFAVQMTNFEEIFIEIDKLGKLTGKEERATKLISDSRQELTAIEEKLSDVPKEKRPTCYFSWAESKLDAAGGISTGSHLVSLAGGRSVTAEIKQEHVKLNMERIVGWNPEVIMAWCSPVVSPEKFMNDSQWQGIAAVQNQRVYQLPDAFLCDLWTLKYIYGVRSAAAYLHPTLFNDDLKQEKTRILKILYGQKGEKLANATI